MQKTQTQQECKLTVSHTYIYDLRNMANYRNDFSSGYFVHVSTLGEVQEQVLKYLPVMSRPMVIYGRHEITWTPVYADLVVSSIFYWLPF